MVLVAAAGIVSAATQLPHGKVVVTGGADDMDDVLNTVEVYDQVNQRWVRGGSVEEHRFLHTATTLQDGRILGAGGETIIDVNQKPSAERGTPTR